MAVCSLRLQEIEMKKIYAVIVVLICTLMVCCKKEKDKIVSASAVPKEDSIIEDTDSDEFDLYMAQLFCDMWISAHTKKELLQYGIADIRPIDSIRKYWNIVDSCEYELYFLDGLAYKYKNLEELCLNRLVYTKEEYRKIKKNPSYNVFECRFRTWEAEEQERDTIINYVLVHYLH